MRCIAGMIPVFSTVILFLIVVASAIAIAFFVACITKHHVSHEKLEILVKGKEYDTVNKRIKIYLLLINDGTRDITVMYIFVNNKLCESSDPPLPLTLKAGEKVNLEIEAVLKLIPGQTIEIKIRTSSDIVYTKLITG